MNWPVPQLSSVVGRIVLLLVLLAPGPARAQSAGQAQDIRMAEALNTRLREGLEAVKQSDWATATERFTQAHLIAPEHPVPLYNLGLAQMSAGNPTAAIAWWEAYLVAAPNADNASRVRAEIARLRQAAVEDIRRYFERARTALEELGGSERANQLSSIETFHNTVAPLLATAASDSIRVSLASALVEVGGSTAALAHLERVEDAALRDAALESHATTFAKENPAAARRFALALMDSTRRNSVLARITREQEATRTDSVLYARLQRGEYPAAEVADYIARGEQHAPNAGFGGGGLFRALVADVARHGFYDEARALASSATESPERETLLTELAAAKVRAGDLQGARIYAEELINRAGVQRNEIMLAAEAVRRVTNGDVEAGLQSLVSRIADGRVRSSALASVAHIATERQKPELAERARQLQQALPAANGIDIVLPLAIMEDYEGALALATVMDPRWATGWTDGSYETGGMVHDFLGKVGALEIGFAKIAFVAALRGRRAEVRRAIERSTDPARRYFVYRNASWADILGGRFEDASDYLETWPAPAEYDARQGVQTHGNTTPSRAYHYSRAQVLAALATRAARSGRFSDAERALASMPPVGAAPFGAAVLARLAAEAAMDVGEAYAGKGDTVSARRVYAMAADAVHAYRTDPQVLRAPDPWWNDQVLRPALTRLPRLDLETANRLGAPRQPQIAAWSRVALAAAEPPGAMLHRLSLINVRNLPTWYAWVGRRIFEDMIRIQGAEAEIMAMAR